MKEKIKAMIIIFELLLLIFISVFFINQHIDLLDLDLLTGVASKINGGSNKPIIEVTSNVIRGKEPLEVSFTVNVVEDDEWKVYTYYWDFGDGRTSFEKNPNHIYHNYGLYVVYLDVNFTNGEKTQKRLEIDVLKNKPPRATAWVTGTSNGAPTTVYFHGKGTDPDGIIVSYKWTGDVTGNKPQVSHYYSRSGHYHATLTVTDDNGEKDSVSVSFYLSERWESRIVSMFLKPIHRWIHN